MLATPVQSVEDAANSIQETAEGIINNPEVQAVVQWVFPAAFAVGGIILGLFFEWVVIKAMHKFAGKTSWKWDDIVAAACRRTIAGLVSVAGFWFAVQWAPISEGTASLITKILGAFAAVIATIFIARLAAQLLALFLSRTGKAIASASLITNSVKFLILAVGILFVINDFVEVTPLIGALGIGGLAAALALQDTLSNLFSGFQIIAARQVRPGDYVSLAGGQLGVVTDVNWRNVSIKSHPDENLIIVPNSEIATTVMINYSLPRQMLMESVDVGVSYGSDLEHVEKVAQQVAEETIEELSGIKPTVPPQIRFREFGDSSINFQTRMYLPQLKGRANYKHVFIKKLHKRFGEEGIEIPFPIRTVYMNRQEGE